MQNSSFLDLDRSRDAIFLAWKDFTVPYRRTLVGPIWEVLSAVIWIAGLSLVFYSPIEFDSHLEFVSYVACGVVSYGFVANIISSGPTLFIQSASIILNIKISPMFLIQRQVYFCTMRFGAQLIAALMAVILFGPGLTLMAFGAVIGILMAIVAAIWTTTILSLVGAKAHDLAPIAVFVSRILLFMSPVFWAPGSSGLKEILAQINPVTHYIALIRAPLLQQQPDLYSWTYVIALNFAGCICAFFVYKAMRPRLVNWI